MPSDPDNSDEIPVEPEGGEARNDDPRTGRVLRMARRLLDRKDLGQDTRELLLSVLATSDKAKTEAVRMVAREVRAYLEALELKDDLVRLLTGHSLEISIRLEPLADALDEPDASGDPPGRAGKHPSGGS